MILQMKQNKGKTINTVPDLNSNLIKSINDVKRQTTRAQKQES
jgi:hypothetical protein